LRARAHVESSIWPNGQTILSSTSDSSHTFFFSDLLPGEYQMKASKNFYVTTKSDEVEVVAGATTEIILTLPEETGPTDDIEVTILDPNGLPMSGVVVSTSITPDEQPTLTQTTGASGVVTFILVKPGNYEVSASASGFNNANSGALTVNAGRTTDIMITMHSNVLERFLLNAITSPQYKDEEFDVTITAIDPFGERYEGYSGTNTLSGSDVQISPTSTDAFVNGIWSGRVKVLEAKSSTYLTTTSLEGKSGRSNSFEVVIRTPPTLDHFVFDPVGTPKTEDTSFNRVIRAMDQYGAPLSNYNGYVTLSVLVGTISPFKTEALSGGSWSGSVTIHAVTGQEVAITAKDGSYSGTSNSFIVEAQQSSGNILDYLQDIISLWMRARTTPHMRARHMRARPLCACIEYVSRS
jgi:hypothetical protein